jgi:hypothetical protein
MLFADAARCMTTTSGNSVLELHYPKAFAEAIMPTLPKADKRFRYVHLTGATVERDQERPLWLKSGVRKIKVCRYLFCSSTPLCEFSSIA